MVKNNEIQEPLPEERPVCSDECTESDSKRPAKDGDDYASHASRFSSEPALVSNQQVDDIIGDLNQNIKQLEEDIERFNNAVLHATKKIKLSYMETPKGVLPDFKLESGDEIEEYMPSGGEAQNPINEPRRAPISQKFVDSWNLTAIHPANFSGEGSNSDRGFYDFVLRAHKLFFQTPCYCYKFTQFVTGAIARNLCKNNMMYWASRGDFSQDDAQDSHSEREFSGWYDKICSYIAAYPNIKDHILDHLVCAAMVAIYYAFEDKKTAIVLCVGIFTLYYYRTGRNVISENVFTYLMGRLEHLFSNAPSTHSDYFNIGGKSSLEQKPSQIFKWLNVSAKQLSNDSSLVTQAGDDSESKGWFDRDVVKSIEGFYKELQALKLTPLLLGVTGVIAVSGFCAVTGRSHDEIADFDVKDYMQAALDFERIGSVTQIWDSIKAIYTDVRTYFEFKYLSDKKRSYWEFRDIRKKLIEWEEQGKELSIHIPESAWATMNVTKQLKWRLDYCNFREYAEKELMANKDFEVVRAIYGRSQRLLRVKTMYSNLSNHYMTILSHRFRPASYGINIEGGTGIAKSTIVMMLQQFILNHHLGIDKELIKQLTYYYSGDDSAFWDGATSSHLLCVMDDVDKYLQAIEPEGNKGIKALLAIMNNLPFNLNQAQLELKGKVFAMYYAVIGTSNTITGINGRSTMDVSGIYKHPGAIGRRFKLIVQILPTLEFDNGSGSIDSNKLAQFELEHPGVPPNAWRIKCLRTVASNNGYLVSEPQYRPIANPRLVDECGDLASAQLQHGQNLYFYDIVDFFNMLAGELESHDEIQQRFFEASTIGYDFQGCGIRATNGAPQAFKDLLGRVDPPGEIGDEQAEDSCPPADNTMLTTQSGLPDNPATRAFVWPCGLLGIFMIYHMIVWLYGVLVHTWYVLYNAYQDVRHFFELSRRIGGFYRTVIYYRDSARLSNWVDRHRTAIALLAGTSAASAAAFKVYHYFSKKDDKQMQSGKAVRTVPLPHDRDFIAAYEAPRVSPAVTISNESGSIQEGHMISSCGKNKTHIVKMTFFDPSVNISSDTHATVISYQGDRPPRGFFNQHAINNWCKKHGDSSWYVKIFGIIAGSKDQVAIFPGEYFLSRLVKLPQGDTRDLAIINLEPPPGVDWHIRAFKRNDQYLLSKDNFIGADGKMKDTLIQSKVTFVRLQGDEMRVNSGGLVEKVIDEIDIKDPVHGTYNMGSCLWAEMQETTEPGDCGNPYLLQKVTRPGVDKAVECAIIGIHGAGSTHGNHFTKLIVFVCADDVALPSPLPFKYSVKPAIVGSDLSVQGAELRAYGDAGEFDDRRRKFKELDDETCKYPVPVDKIMHFPKIDMKSNGEIKQHDKSKKIEAQALMMAGSLTRPVSNFAKSTAQWISDTMGTKAPKINDVSAHLYGTCRSIDVCTHEGTRNYTVALGSPDSDWNISPLYGDLNGHQLTAVDEVIKTNKIPPLKHVAVVKEAKCLKGDFEYDKLNQNKLLEYDTASILSDIMSQSAYDEKLAEKMYVAADHYLDSVLSKIDVTKEIMRFPVEEGIPINGLVSKEGVRYKSLESLDMKTSSGPPLTFMRPGMKGKYEWFTQVKHHPDGRIERAMGPTLEYFVDECRTRMRKGDRVVHQVAWKDEPANPLSEGDRKPKRPIFVGPLYFSILMREYLLSINRAMAAFPFVFQQAVGFDSSSQQWAQVRNYVFGRDSSNKVFDGDYRKFDRGLIQEVTDAVRYFIMTLCIKSGNYDEDDLIIANNILKCATSPVVNFGGTIYNFRSLNTSGNPLTTQINCIANNILIWYVFLDKYNTLNYGAAHKLYMDYVRAMVYGDDNIVGSVPHPEYDQVITCNDMQERLHGIIGYTDAAKNSIVQPHAPHHQITLLGRYFVEEGGMVLDKFELKRLWRMLLMYRHRSNVPVVICLRDIYDSALYELARYDADLFNEVRNLLIEGVLKYQIKDLGWDYTRDQIVQMFFCNNQGVELTYEHYRQKIVDHNSQGRIDDPRYAECCLGGNDLSLQSGDCYYMSGLPFNATEFVA